MSSDYELFSTMYYRELVLDKLGLIEVLSPMNESQIKSFMNEKQVKSLDSDVTVWDINKYPQLFCCVDLFNNKSKNDIGDFYNEYMIVYRYIRNHIVVTNVSGLYYFDKNELDLITKRLSNELQLNYMRKNNTLVLYDFVIPKKKKLNH
jgi:hypothetical protein